MKYITQSLHTVSGFSPLCLFKAPRLRVQHAAGCGGAHRAQGAQLDAAAVLAGREVHRTRDLLTADDLGDGGAPQTALAQGKFKKKKKTTAVDLTRSNK